MKELLLRLPRALEADTLPQWEVAARKFGGALLRMGLWNWLSQERIVDIFEKWANQIKIFQFREFYEDLKYRNRIIVDSNDVSRILFVQLFGGGLGIDGIGDQDWVFQVWRNWEAEYYSPLRIQSWNVLSDPIEDLSLVPLPRGLAQVVSEKPREDANLAHLLKAITGSPSEILSDGQNGQEAVAILLFAASWIIAGTTPTSVSAPVIPRWKVHTLSQPQERRLNELGMHAWIWLAGSLPRLVFPKRLEAVIGTASSLRYRNAPSSRSIGTRTEIG